MAQKGNVLPFERGSIWQDGNTANTGQSNGLPGTYWASKDSDRPSNRRHGFNIDEELIVLRNRHSAAIGLRHAATSVAGVGSRGYILRTAASNDGDIGGLASHGRRGYLLEDSLNSNSSRVPIGCDAYFVNEGLAKAVLFSSAPGAATANQTLVMFATNGTTRAITWATGRPRAYGMAKETWTNTATYRSVVVAVGPRYIQQIDNL